MMYTYDKGTDAMYIYVKGLVGMIPVWGMVKDMKGNWPLHFDYDKNGMLLGIEIMDARTIFGTRRLWMYGSSMKGWVQDLETYKKTHPRLAKEINMAIKAISS